MRTISIRQSLLRSHLLVIALLAGGILAATIFGARRTVEVLSRGTIRQTTDTTLARLDGFFEPVRRELRILRDFGAEGLLELEAPEALRPLLVPLLLAHPQITSALVTDARGREAMLLRREPQWRLRLTRPDEWGPRADWLEWSDQAPEAASSSTDTDYDARRRPWYRGAMAAEAEQIHWTEPYTFFTTQEPGITASLRFAPDGRDPRVVAVDVLLAGISEFSMGLRAGENGLVYVATDSGQVVGLPADPRFEAREARRAALLTRPDELAIPPIRDALLARQAQRAVANGPFRFASRGQSWWGQVTRYPLSPARVLLVGVVVPESDLLGNAAQLRLAIAGITLAVILVAVLRSLGVARRLGGPIESLVVENDRIAHGDLRPGNPIHSRVTEVRRLAQAQEHMRDAVGALMKVERDLQLAREIQLGTLPGTLPALSGFAVAAWSQPAEETGGDTYDAVAYRQAGGGLPVLGDENADRALLLMADATGHGVGPALSVTQVRAMLRMALRGGAGLTPLVQHLNEQLAEDLPPGRFVTAWLGDLDARRHTLTSFSAGQAPLLLHRAGSAEVETLPADAPPLGVLPQLDAAVPAPLSLAPGDVFAVFSDGVFEACDPEGREFGQERVSALILSHARAGPERLLEQLRRALEAFQAGTAARDDQTALLIQRLR